MARARRVDLLPERDPGLDVALRREHEIGDLAGELDPGRRRSGLGEHRMALRWPRHRQRPGDVVVLTVEVGGGEPRAVGPAPGGAVPDDRVLGPAVPQPPRHLDELGRPRVAVVVLGVRVTPEVQRRLGVVGGDDVPPDPPTGHVIGGRQPARQLVGLVVGGRRGADQADLTPDHPDRGEQRDRVVAQLREVVGAKQRQRGRVGEEHRVEQAALSDRGRLG